MEQKINGNDASLEKRIIRFTRKAEELLGSNPSLGLRYLHQSHKLYNKLHPEKDVYKKISRAITKYSNKINHGVD